MNEAKGKSEQIDPSFLELETTDKGIQIVFKGNPLRLHNGELLSHSREALLQHICEEFSGFGTITIDDTGRVIKPDIISSYRLLGVQYEIESDPNHVFLTDFQKWLYCDPCLRRCAGPEVVDQMVRWWPLLEYLDDLGLTLPSFPQSPFELEGNEQLETILDDSETDDEYVIKLRRFFRGIEEALKSLGPEEQCCIYYLYACHEAILFPLLIAVNRCSVQEYANGLMATHCLLSVAFGDIGDEDHAEQTRGFREDAQVVKAYLDNARCPWIKDIDKGENEVQEFKATLRYDLAKEIFNKELEHAVLKNIAGFLNSKGGKLFVGVADDGRIQGIELDRFDNDDKWSLHLVNRIGQQMGKHFINLCTIEFDIIHGKKVALITVEQSNQPAYLNECPLKSKGDKQAFFVRGGPSAQKLSPEETAKYLLKQFPTTSS